jgi:hypothetical protein
VDVPLGQLELLAADGHAEVAAVGEFHLEGPRRLSDTLLDGALAASIKAKVQPLKDSANVDPINKDLR